MAPGDDASEGNGMSDDHREAIDQAFAELVAGYHLTADRSDPPMAEHSAEQQPPVSTPPESRPDLTPEAEHIVFRLPEPIELASSAEPEEPFIPPPVEPLPRLSASALLGWIGIGYAVVFVLLTAVGIRLPALGGWLAIGGFVGSFAILLSQLPRSRPPGTGAVL
jgi:hypothetical protein